MKEKKNIQVIEITSLCALRIFVEIFNLKISWQK